MKKIIIPLTTTEAFLIDPQSVAVTVKDFSGRERELRSDEFEVRLTVSPTGRSA